MNLADILDPERVRLADDVASKKRALEALAEALTQGTPYLTAGEILTGLIAREKLGNTGIGGGVAMPRARLRGVDECVGAALRLAPPVAFASGDEAPVDIVFGLIVPAASSPAHRDLLDRLTALLSERRTLAELRAAADAAALYRLLIERDPVAH